MRWRVGRTMTCWVALIALLLIDGGAARAQESRRCFAETGQCISGPIRTYWERNGGLPTFGLPISAAREELVEGRALVVQWFERDRLEIQPDGAITAGRLGARYLELTGRPWQRGEGGGPAAGCRWFDQTGYQVCGAMRAYWERNGGLERFGYPLTDLITETIEGRSYEVQYFERRRLESHPEHAGTPYALLLGLLGREIYTAAVCPAASTEVLQRAVRTYLATMGCPIDGGRSARALAWQRYEHGVMYWIDAASGAPPMIFILVNRDAEQRTIWLARTDTYRPGEPVGGAAPPGRIAPANGFGKVWWAEPDISAALGWPIEVEQSGVGAALAFRRGGWVLARDAPSLVIVMQPNGEAFGVRPELLQRDGGA
jgi:hypothetical protein